ncbi:MAG: hypothetical protein KIT61_13570 [Pyrinomonadaceae bacterium]|nr:hypothetical protein [Pyrinomonadaceae bacterium]
MSRPERCQYLEGYLSNLVVMGKEKGTRKMIADVVEGKDGDKDMGM